VCREKTRPRSSGFVRSHRPAPRRRPFPADAARAATASTCQQPNASLVSMSSASRTHARLRHFGRGHSSMMRRCTRLRREASQTKRRMSSRSPRSARPRRQGGFRFAQGASSVGCRTAACGAFPQADGRLRAGKPIDGQFAAGPGEFPGCWVEPSAIVGPVALRSKKWMRWLLSRSNGRRVFR